MFCHIFIYTMFLAQALHYINFITTRYSSVEGTRLQIKNEESSTESKKADFLNLLDKSTLFRFKYLQLDFELAF